MKTDQTYLYEQCIGHGWSGGYCDVREGSTQGNGNTAVEAPCTPCSEARQPLHSSLHALLLLWPGKPEKTWGTRQVVRLSGCCCDSRIGGGKSSRESGCSQISPSISGGCPDRKLLISHAVSIEVNGIRSSQGCSHLAEIF